MRVCLVIIDGIADTGRCTPLQEVTAQGQLPTRLFDVQVHFQACTPCMDAIARAGANGLMDPVEPVRTLLLLRHL
jgi:2,3-bisphosphoglycerate-independent phosphoglycerate mutase